MPQVNQQIRIRISPLFLILALLRPELAAFLVTLAILLPLLGLA